LGKVGFKVMHCNIESLPKNKIKWKVMCCITFAHLGYKLARMFLKKMFWTGMTAGHNGTAER